MRMRVHELNCLREMTLIDQDVIYEPVFAKHGNATLEGRFRLKDLGGQTRLIVEMQGELRDVPVPLMYRLVAPPFIQGRFIYLVDNFLQRTGEAVVGRPLPGADSV